MKAKPETLYKPPIAAFMLLVFVFTVFCFLTVTPPKANAQPGEVSVTINLRGVYGCKISLLPLTGPALLRPIISREGVKEGETIRMNIQQEYLPGEFVLRFDYWENPGSTPYPSEKRIIIANQDLELWINPKFANNNDSTWFQTGERENTVYMQFLRENARQKEILGLLQNFLLNYDETGSDFYGEGVREHEKRRLEHNLWIENQSSKHNSLFVSNMFGFQKVPLVNWEGSTDERMQSLRVNYLGEVDFNNPQLIKTTGMREWMDGYMGLHGEVATSVRARDSLFILAGSNAIEKARRGHPAVYGWMVDYFFQGYERSNLGAGILMLQPYLDDPNCMTARRMAIIKRLEGMKTIQPGMTAPGFKYRDQSGNEMSFPESGNQSSVSLLLFWSTDCKYCIELIQKLHSWYLDGGNNNPLSVFAINLDREDQKPAWEEISQNLHEWVQIWAGGVNGKIGSSYYILSTPVMVVVDMETSKIIALPQTFEEFVACI